MEEETIKTQLKNLDLEVGNLKIITKRKAGEQDRALTGVDFDVFIDGKNFRDTPLHMMKAIDIHIGDAETIAKVIYTCYPFVNKKEV